MITIDNITYRNLQEQVEKNKRDIEAWSSIEVTLNNFGIKVLGRVDYVSDIPEATFEYGDAYLVGLNEPFDIYIYTRTDGDVGMFVDMGPLNVVGQEGPQGPQGPAGKDGYAPVVRYGNGLPIVEPTDKKGYIYIDQQTSRLYTFDNGWNFVINMQGPKGDQGNQGIQGATGTTLSIVAKLSSPSLLPTNFASGSIPKNSAYLVDVNGANHLYIILGNQSDYSTWYWQDAGDFNLGSVIYKDSVFQTAVNITDSYNTNTGAVVTDTATNNMNNNLQAQIDTKVSQTTFENELLTKADVNNVVTPNELTDTINSTKEELNTNINNVNDNLTGLINGKQDKLNASQTSAVNSGINAVLVNRINTNRINIDSINDKIPAQASSSNQLADKAFVNSSINSIAAYFITKNANGDSFATKAELTAATTFYSGGVERVPTRNDYCIVIKDETHDNATTRYIYNNNWEYQYTINETPLTAEQLAALNSGITSDLVTEFNGKQTALNQTQMNAVNSGITADLVSTFNNKQNALNSSQLAAVNSGITQSLVSTFNQKTTTKVNGVATDLEFTSNPQTQIGNLNSLATTDKTSLVNAINEVKNSGGNNTKAVFKGKQQFLSYVNWSDYGVTAQDFTNYDYLEITWGSKSEIKNAYLLPTMLITSNIKNYYPLYANNDKLYTTTCLYVSKTQFAHNNNYYYYGSSSGSNSGVYIYKIRFVRF